MDYEVTKKLMQPLMTFKVVQGDTSECKTEICLLFDFSGYQTASENTNKKRSKNMEHKHAIVTDAEGYKTEFVLVNIWQENGQTVETPLYYEMQEGERLVYNQVPEALAMSRPRWNGGTWEETATAEEMAALEQQRAGFGLEAPIEA